MNVLWRINAQCLYKRQASAWVTIHRHYGVEAPKIKPPGKVGSYVVKKYILYLEKFEAKFETKYPKIYKVYKLFKDGVKDFFVDTKIYYRVATDIWGGKPLSTFSRKELETYRQFPREFIRVSPVVILLNIPISDIITPIFVALKTGKLAQSKIWMPSDMLRSAPVIIAVPLPLVPYFLYPIAYMFPRQLLCRHFWTEKQRVEFAQRDLIKHRMQHFKKVLDYMENRSAKVKDPGQKRLLTEVLYQIEQNKEPEVEAILDLKNLFTSKPFGIEHLMQRHKLHVWHLARGLGLSGGRKFLQDATIFHHIDLAMYREGIDSMSYETLQQCCFARGLNAAGVSEMDLKSYLDRWTLISSKLDISSISLMLHGPVLLGYPQPSNRKLLAKYETYENL